MLCFSSKSQTIYDTIELVRSYNDTAVTNQIRFHGLTHNVEGYMYDTTLGFIKRAMRMVTTAGNLQAVTNAGDTTNNFMIVGDGTFRAIHNTGHFDVFKDAGNVLQASIGMTFLAKPGIELKDPASSNYGIIMAGPLTGLKAYLLPDDPSATGTGLGSTLMLHTTPNALTVTDGTYTGIYNKNLMSLADGTGNLTTVTPTNIKIASPLFSGIGTINTMFSNFIQFKQLNGASSKTLNVWAAPLTANRDDTLTDEGGKICMHNTAYDVCVRTVGADSTLIQPGIISLLNGGAGVVIDEQGISHLTSGLSDYTLSVFSGTPFLQLKDAAGTHRIVVTAGDGTNPLTADWRYNFPNNGGTVCTWGNADSIALSHPSTNIATSDITWTGDYTGDMNGHTENIINITKFNFKDAIGNTLVGIDGSNDASVPAPILNLTGGSSVIGNGSAVSGLQDDGAGNRTAFTTIGGNAGFAITSTSATNNIFVVGQTGDTVLRQDSASRIITIGDPNGTHEDIDTLNGRFHFYETGGLYASAYRISGNATNLSLGSYGVWNAAGNKRITENVNAGTMVRTVTNNGFTELTNYPTFTANTIIAPRALPAGTYVPAFLSDITGTGTVTSVSNSDGSIIVSTPSPNPDVSLNTGNVNVWSGLQEFQTARFQIDGGGGNHVVLEASASAGSNYFLKLPPSQGAADQVMMNDASGNLYNRSIIKQAMFSGNGVSTTFTITVPTAGTACLVQSATPATAIVTGSSISGTTITITCAAAPAAGTNNVTFNYSWNF